MSWGIDTFDCAMPTRLARHGAALVPDPDGGWRLDVTGSRHRRSQELVMKDCPCPMCSEGFTIGYLAYLHRIKEQTGPRLITLHNLAYTARLMLICARRSLPGSSPSGSPSSRWRRPARLPTDASGRPYPGRAAAITGGCRLGLGLLRGLRGLGVGRIVHTACAARSPCSTAFACAGRAPSGAPRRA